jgi:hypothetical protein
VDGEFHTVPNALHEMKDKELKQLYEWINQRIPAAALDQPLC